ncbi:hypothetical protein M4D50_10990 [Rothia sp. p3-SID1597]|nr:hypothetical protein [Rothia sp. p3-SID1597]
MTEKRGSMTRRKPTQQQTHEPTNVGMGAAFPNRTEGETQRRLSVDVPESAKKKIKRIATERDTTVRKLIIDFIHDLDT